MKLIKIHDIQTEIPTVWCKVFEDNTSALKLATSQKYRPRRKHVNLQHHHFRHQMKKGGEKILPIYTKDQIANIFRKGL